MTKCGKCKSGDVEEEHDLINLCFLDGAGYFLDFPFGPKKVCNKCGDESSDSGDCFVATAVYRDVNAPQVQVLREFRDEVLKNNYLGKAFVNFYYSGAGKTTANFIKKYIPFTIPEFRKCLDAVVDRIEKTKHRTS